MGEQEKKELPKHVHKSITTGKVVEKSKLEKALALFFSEDAESFKGSIMDDYIRPRTKEFLADSIRKFKQFIFDNFVGAAEIIFFGKTKGSQKRGFYNGQEVNYYSYYTSDGEYVRREERRDRDPETHLKRIVISEYGKAKQVLGELIGFCKHYKKATVADYYQLVELAPSEIDFSYGWFDLTAASIIETRGGYIIDFPKPIPLK